MIGRFIGKKLAKKAVKKAAKRVGKQVGKKVATKAMTSAQKGALKKAVKASAIARKKSFVSPLRKLKKAPKPKLIPRTKVAAVKKAPIAREAAVKAPQYKSEISGVAVIGGIPIPMGNSSSAMADAAKLAALYVAVTAAISPARRELYMYRIEQLKEKVMG